MFIGPNDLALSHGYEPSLESHDPRLERKILEIRDACRGAGVIAGIYAGSPENALRWAQEGFQLIALLSDAALVSRGAQYMMAELSGKTAQDSSGGYL